MDSAVPSGGLEEFEPPLRTCEHPDGCLQPKYYTEYTKLDGTVSRHYRKYCRPHVNRLGRYGDLGSVDIRPKAEAGIGSVSKSGYREFHLPNHPLATKNGKVLEHRKVLYDAIGPDDTSCHWCACLLMWQSNLTVDHIDFDKLNNDPTNLVPSCQSCNTRRFNALVRYIIKNKLVDREVLLCLG